MLEQLYKFLILNKKASVPGIGIFYIARKPASLDFSRKAFIAPSFQIAFTEGAAVAEKKFCAFLSREQQIGEREAVQHLGDFAQTLKTGLQANGRVELPGFGLLSKDVSGAIKFQSAAETPAFFADVATERTVREAADVIVPVKPERKAKDRAKHAVANHEEVMVAPYKKDYWWVFAILLAGAAIAAIIFYYNQHGSFR